MILPNPKTKKEQIRRTKIESVRSTKGKEKSEAKKKIQMLSKEVMKREAERERN